MQKLTRRTLLQMALGVTVGGLAGASAARAAKQDKRLRTILLMGGVKSHPPGQHEYGAGCTLLKKCLDGVPGVETRLVTEGWPKDAAIFDGVDAIFLFMDGGGGHPAIQDDRLVTLGNLMKRGVGLGALHWATEVPADRGGPQFTEWIGGYYENEFSCNPFWKPTFETLPRHPVTRGVKPFAIEDEWYFNLRFPAKGNRTTPILTAKPSDAVRKGPYAAPPGPFPHILAASGRTETLLWVTERPDGGRGFGFTGGHYHKNWANDDFRKIVLNALLWIAKAEVPKNGVPSAIMPTDLAIMV